MRRRLILLIQFIFAFIGNVFSQSIITGSIEDSLHNPIAGVNVVYRKITGNVIMGYVISDRNGMFELKLNDSMDSILLSIRHISYQEKKVVLKNTSGKYHFILGSKVTVLKDVVVAKKPIYQINDTINYDVNTFTYKEDRVIGDVIRKLPGIEMEGNKILYNGKPLLKYYINGLNLLDGRYAIANNNLPIDAVKNVQIIENDQPIKILDSLTFSNSASLNIQLKKYLTTGTAKLGIGAGPLLWDANLTPMTFNKSFQIINSFQANNIGDDISKQLNSYTADDVGFFFDAPLPVNNYKFTGVRDLAQPPFDKKRWLENNIKMGSSNLLKKFDNGLELKGNISVYNDYQQIAGNTYTKISTPGGNIIVSENLHNNYNTSDLQGDFTLLKNDKKIYLKNKLSIGKKWDDKNGLILRNQSNSLSQWEKLHFFFINNVFTSTMFLGKHLVGFNANIHYSESPQRLTVSPGVFQNILNDSLPYNKATQQVLYKDLFIDNNLSFIQRVGHISLIAKLGILFQQQLLESNLGVESLPINPAKQDGFGNDIQFTAIKAYLNPTLRYNNMSWKLQLEMPARLQQFSLKYKIPTGASTTLNNVVFNPNMSVVYDISSLWELFFNMRYDNQFGDLSQLYNDYMLTSYNRLQKSKTGYIGQSNQWSNSLSLKYKNLVNSLLADVMFHYDRTRNNYLANNFIDAVGATSMEMLLLGNARKTTSVTATVSKLYSPIKSTFKLIGNINNTTSPQLFNSDMSMLKISSYTASMVIYNNLFELFDFNYRMNLSFITSRLSEKKLDDIRLQTHLLEMNVFPVKHQMLTIHSDFYINKLRTKKNQAFLDVKYTYTLPKKKIDFALSCNNLLNTKNYIILYNSSYSIIESQYGLRPRQFVATVRFSFK
ncbi:hypothetical protein [Chitinophaga eiseniae]|uniref:CarboxypepD_reg-like domain-containing protein n=1 Tax=Chitinophaga eiseniae TaxID=634771 RepID=A0A847SHT4_9BACT|nr:hypothetical protein [Chitinophaga eiseniae]NLR78585.1 hypothetical protein [Chitinophaga eiseniae]